jgi:3-oxoacyl-[acyl-carrier-protein] synthase-1
LTHLTAVSAIGLGRAAMLAALRDRQTGLRRCDFGGVSYGHIGRVAAVEQHRLPPSLAAYDCRNNRLADLALRQDGFAAQVARARARYGAGRIAIVVGTSTSGILSAEEAFRDRDPETGALPARFTYAHSQAISSLPAFLGAALELEGPAFTVSTACASSARAVIDAAHLIAAGICDAALVGGADSLCRMTLAGFNALELIAPEACRPCAADRAGISIGEAAAFALLEPVPATGMRLLGWGTSSDGYHMSTPDPEARGAILAMRQALARADLPPEAVDYINMHGTGTRANDAMEDRAITAVFGDTVAASATKGWTGHTLGACGMLEAVIVALALEHGFAPGCLGLAAPDPAFRARILTENRYFPLRVAMSNAFGFGGINCSLLLGSVP